MNDIRKMQLAYHQGRAIAEAGEDRGSALEFGFDCVRGYDDYIKEYGNGDEN